MANGEDGGRTVAGLGDDEGGGATRLTGGEAGGVTRLDSGWFVDEPAQLERLYGAGGPGVPPLRPDRRLWQIATPFLMDQQAARIAREVETGEVAARRRRRPPPPPPDPVTAALTRLMEERAAASVPASVPASGPTPDEYRQNNASARRAAARLLEVAIQPSEPLSCHNPAGAPRLLSGGGRQYVLPAGCRFLCGDVTSAFEDADVVRQLVGDGPRFDCVLLDPPWSNKFVRRKRKRDESAGYRCLEAASLTRLPLSQLAADGALVAVWCTNSAAHQHTLRHTLLPAWSVQQCAVWHWVKVTQYGQPVTAAGHHSKQPYELLVLGRRGPPPAGLPPLPADRLLVSVPSAVHSRKPLLHEILRPYLPAGYRGLEVFARGLLPDWTAWGDQPLLLQQLGALLLTEQQAEQQAEEQQQLLQDDRGRVSRAGVTDGSGHTGETGDCRGEGRHAADSYGLDGGGSVRQTQEGSGDTQSIRHSEQPTGPRAASSEGRRPQREESAAMCYGV